LLVCEVQVVSWLCFCLWSAARFVVVLFVCEVQVVSLLCCLFVKCRLFLRCVVCLWSAGCVFVVLFVCEVQVVSLLCCLFVKCRLFLCCVVCCARARARQFLANTSCTRCARCIVVYVAKCVLSYDWLALVIHVLFFILCLLYLAVFNQLPDAKHKLEKTLPLKHLVNHLLQSMSRQEHVVGFCLIVCLSVGCIAWLFACVFVWLFVSLFVWLCEREREIWKEREREREREREIQNIKSNNRTNQKECKIESTRERDRPTPSLPPPNRLSALAGPMHRVFAELWFWNYYVVFFGTAMELSWRRIGIACFSHTGHVHRHGDTLGTMAP
jgi:hypothetical protein